RGSPGRGGWRATPRPDTARRRAGGGRRGARGGGAPARSARGAWGWGEGRGEGRRRLPVDAADEGAGHERVGVDLGLEDDAGVAVGEKVLRGLHQRRGRRGLDGAEASAAAFDGPDDVA